MMLTGTVRKERGGWYAGCDALGAYTQATSRSDARAMLADCIEVKIGRGAWRAKVTEIGPAGPDEYTVLVDSDQPEILAAEVLKHQRVMHGLTLADVQKKLGAASIDAYAAYEQGKREPSLSKFRELLAAVAPEMMLIVGARSTKPKRKVLATHRRRFQR